MDEADEGVSSDDCGELDELDEQIDDPVGDVGVVGVNFDDVECISACCL